MLRLTLMMNDDLFLKLSTNKKYSDVCPDTIRRMISECDGRYKKAKDMEKAVRERLHGITSAFNDLGSDIGEAVASIRDDDSLTAVLQRHSSTRERLPLSAMDALYSRIFAVTGRPESILDLACGLNPIYLRHRVNCPVVGVDISRSCVSLLDAGDACRGIWGDLLCSASIPADRFHIALLFKILPLLERQKTGASLEVLRTINAEFLVVSFPTRTLGGRNVGMEAHYTTWMEGHLPQNRAVMERFAAENELFYILKEN